MTAKPVVPRLQANQDVDAIIAHYLAEDISGYAAFGFVDVLERAYLHIGHRSGSGSPRYAHEIDLAGLRAWPLTRAPHLVFYVEHPDPIDVWRVLHGQRDIAEWMHEPDSV